MREQQRDTAVLVMAMGGPSSLDDIEVFLSRFMGGKRVPQERIEAIKARYRLIGGRSPLVDITLRQTRALEKELARRGRAWRALAGMRFSEPFIADRVNDMMKWGIQGVLAVPLALYRSKLSTVPYFATLKEAMDKQKASFHVLEISGWHRHPLFVEAVAEKVTEGLSRFPPDIRVTIPVVFTAHSLPEKAVCDDPYVDDIQETIESLIGRVGPLTWRLAFQSRGRGPECWLGPDVSEVLDDLSGKGYKRVLVVPLGFVSDHLETLYDLDIHYRHQAEKRGLAYQRAPSLNDSPLFVQALAQIVSDAVQ
jgi:ferrochelatase